MGAPIISSFVFNTSKRFKFLDNRGINFCLSCFCPFFSVLGGRLGQSAVSPCPGVATRLGGPTRPGGGHPATRPSAAPTQSRRVATVSARGRLGRHRRAPARPGRRLDRRRLLAGQRAPRIEPAGQPRRTWKRAAAGGDSRHGRRVSPRPANEDSLCACPTVPALPAPAPPAV